MTLENQPYDHRPAIVQEVLGSPGFPLEPAVRTLMEARFVRDFGHVRLHTDDQAAASARAIGAQAYTVGSHIAFADERYHPETRMGLWLLAHELAHVVQQDDADTPLSLWLGDVNDPLEYAADRTADLVATGRPLPPDFTFGAAPAGVIQCHPAPPCPESVSIPADASTIFEAHQILERAYVWENIGYVQENAVFFGSNWGANPLPIPPGAPRQQFASALLARLLLWPVGDRPNIIDFWLQAAYWFRRVSAESGVVMAITRFHNLVHTLQRQYNEPEWFSISSMWWPDHTQYFPGDPLRRFLCTEATNHNPPRGLILYDIRQPPRRRRRQQPSLPVGSRGR